MHNNGGRTTNMGGRFHQNQGRGRGRPTPTYLPVATTTRITETAFKGNMPSLPILNYGGQSRDNRPIEFLHAIGEHVGVKFKSTIAPAFWTLPPAYGDYEDEPFPPIIAEGAQLSIIQTQEYLHLKKLWLTTKKETEEQRKSVFCLVYGQLSEASRCEVEEHEEWKTKFESKDLLYFIQRIRATHIARQSGNPEQDKERVRAVWSNLRMYHNETSFAFRTRVENYQLERLAVGLQQLPASELVIGVLNRLDMSRYGELVNDLMSNERRNIKALPDNIAVLWKDIKETQVIRFRGLTHPPRMESVYLASAEEVSARDRSSRAGRGRGGRFKPSSRGYQTGHTATIDHTSSGADITCWTCGVKGHRSNICPQKINTKPIHFTE